MAVGYIYILSNKSMPGLVKIGRTDRQPEDRARELSTTGVPTPFRIEYSIFVQDSVASEANVHKILEKRGCRRSQMREFFELSVQEAIELVKVVAGDPTADNSNPDFSLSPFLHEAFSSVALPGYDEAIPESRVSQLEERLSSIGRRGYPYALKCAAELFERNFISSLKFRTYWQEYLELSKLELHFLASAPTSNGLGSRQSLGKDVAEYLDLLARNGWITKADFDFAQQFLLSGNRYIYEGYIGAVSRSEFPSSIREQALNL